MRSAIDPRGADLADIPDLSRRLRLWTPSLAIDGEIVAAAALHVAIARVSGS